LLIELKNYTNGITYSLEAWTILVASLLVCCFLNHKDVEIVVVLCSPNKDEEDRRWPAYKWTPSRRLVCKLPEKRLRNSSGGRDGSNAGESDDEKGWQVLRPPKGLMRSCRQL
jgi:hypothetical protein